MGYVTDEKEPELVYVGNDGEEIEKIKRWVSNMNTSLVDSGFENYQYDLQIVGNKTYIKKR